MLWRRRCWGWRGWSAFGELRLERHHAVVRAEVAHRRVAHGQVVLGWRVLQTLVTRHCLVGLGLQGHHSLTITCEDLYCWPLLLLSNITAYGRSMLSELHQKVNGKHLLIDDCFDMVLSSALKHSLCFRRMRF